MKVLQTIAAAALGTTAMTLFSYWISSAKRKQFREPELLQELLQKLPLQIPPGTAKAAGWLIHYSVGFSFCAIYDAIWRQTSSRPSLANGVVLGGISGIAGISGWHLVLSAHPNPPAVELKKYYGHLMLAHLIFGTFSAIGYRPPIREEKLKAVQLKP
jgi:hypothetical protein